MLSSTVRVLPVRALLWGIGSAVVVTACVDGGSIVLSTMQATDASDEAALAAARAAAGRTVDQQTAREAYAAAVETLASDRDEVVLQAAGDAEDFRLHLDGAVTLTVRRVAPTLLLKYVPAAEDYVDVAVTTHQPPVE